MMRKREMKYRGRHSGCVEGSDSVAEGAIIFETRNSRKASSVHRAFLWFAQPRSDGTRTMQSESRREALYTRQICLKPVSIQLHVDIYAL